MHEISCPACNASSQFDLNDYLQMCPFCSATFSIEKESGKKDIFSDHYIIPNNIDSRQIKGLVMEWLKRLHHSASIAEKEFFVTRVDGISVPHWIVSLEAHSVWKGLVEKPSNLVEADEKAGHIVESGQFRRSYRWCVSAQRNICQYWGLQQVHEPNEKVFVDWDGFPLDSTFSRGRVASNTGRRRQVGDRVEEMSAYDVREFFDFKFSNGLPILNVEIGEEEAMQRCRHHIERYHYRLAKLHVNVLTQVITEAEIAGIQLIHLPFWEVSYVYQPASILRHFSQARNRKVLIEGYAGGVLKGELAVLRKDKLWINGVISSAATAILLFLSVVWHSAFSLVAIFMLIIAITSFYHSLANRKKAELSDAELANI